MRIGILMLAAGQSRRFGSDKRTAQLPSGNTLLRQSLQNALGSGLPVAVCVRPGEESLATAHGAQALVCTEADLGMGHSLAQGIVQLPPWDAVLIALADMPEIQPATFCTIARAIMPETICQPMYHERPGHPVGFSKHFFPALTALRGDVGARRVIEQQAAALIKIPLDDPGIVRDIDTPADLPPRPLST
ncbi:hypothetical protein A3709_17740 [Halioglobus sp. HI00S01]|uniref:nucleotidyltransferase family protein n=1 Tax=Halioglobus sp. HI00S01 TaxID=1822214 RepID=UPI0007C3AE01|nr:nucleotidyltransferase family protein [Halioglobus sp. HI00S01]KZX58831.1 hypothetical protein A3709_17740 [Halioglobus sp. HI00S01]